MRLGGLGLGAYPWNLGSWWSHWAVASPSVKGTTLIFWGRCEINCLGSKQQNKYSVSTAAAAAKSLQSYPTLCDPIDGSPPGSPVPGILQARTLAWVAISFSNAWKWKGKVKMLSCVWHLVTPWTAAHQAPPSMGFSRQDYWSGVPLPSPIKCLRNHKNQPSLSLFS